MISKKSQMHMVCSRLDMDSVRAGKYQSKVAGIKAVPSSLLKLSYLHEKINCGMFSLN